MTDSPIRTAALAALEAQRLALVETAQSHLSALGITTQTEAVHIDVPEGLVVLTDGVVSVAVQNGQVSLVTDEDNAWTRQAGPFQTLAGLGAALENAP